MRPGGAGGVPSRKDNTKGGASSPQSVSGSPRPAVTSGPHPVPTLEWPLYPKHKLACSPGRDELREQCPSPLLSPTPPRPLQEMPVTALGILSVRRGGTQTLMLRADWLTPWGLGSWPGTTTRGGAGTEP